MDLLRLPTVPGVRGLPLQRVLRGVLRPHLQGLARGVLGDPPPRRTADVPQLGPAGAQPDLRRLPLREGRMIAIDVHLDADAAATMARDVRAGLCAFPKELAPKYFYDERGSELFE